MTLIGYFWVAFWAALVLMATWAGLSLRRRVRSGAASQPVVDDEALQEILETGRLEVSGDEPLDLRTIEEEERRFWSETWDEPEEL
ncbi:MAG: hypothetical protein ACE5GJ_00205 [Gemmatimonadota bacterium]